MIISLAHVPVATDNVSVRTSNTATGCPYNFKLEIISDHLVAIMFLSLNEFMSQTILIYLVSYLLIFALVQSARGVWLSDEKKNLLKKILDEQENLPPKYWRKLYTSPYHGPLGFEDGEISQRRFGPNQERSSVVFMPRDLDDYMIAPYKFVWRRNSKFEIGLADMRGSRRDHCRSQQTVNWSQQIVNWSQQTVNWSQQKKSEMGATWIVGHSNF